MSLIDLSTNIGGFLQLRSPLWIASAHYSHKASAIKAWKEIAPAALTLKTSHKDKEVEQKNLIRQKTEKILPRFGRSLYVDGAKQDELLTYADTQELLTYANNELPETSVGISVLADAREDYKELRAMCEGARFCELNLKYSFRAKKNEEPGGLDQFAILKERFDAVTLEVRRFCEAFNALPVFIKLSRELSWLPDTDELGRLIEILRQHGRAGLIVANSLKIDIPPFIAEGTEQELKGGVICGERLFDDTISFIGKVKKDCGGANIPIVATGGMISPEQILTAFRAGASAVQLCTTFDYNRLNFYNTVCWYLQNRTEARGLRSFGEYVERLRGEGIASVYSTPFMYYDNFNGEEFQKRIQQDVRRSHRMDVFVMSGKSLFSKWADPLRQRFTGNLGMRLLLPRTDGPAYVAIQQAWGLNAYELQVRKERVATAARDIQRIWDETTAAREDKTRKETLRIFETEQCPFYSFYLFDDKVYIAPYPFTRPGELNSPVYVFSIGSAEYSRVDDENGRLLSFALQTGAETVSPSVTAPS